MKLVKKLLMVFFLCLPMMMQAEGYNYVSTSQQQDAFVLSAHGKSAKILVANDDWKGVLRAAQDLSADVRRVTGVESEMEIVSLPISKKKNCTQLSSECNCGNTWQK